MNLKNLLKTLKLNENNISMAFGALVIVVVGLMVVNYFRNLDVKTNTLPGANSQKTVQLPTKHTVASGETLWSIAEKYYNSGYNWIDIKEANSLSDASQISVGQELTIPDVSAKTMTASTSAPAKTPVATVAVVSSPVPTVTASASPSLKPTLSPVATPSENTTKGGVTIDTPSSISGDSYTVVKGDNLWDIAVRAYGDGYKWSEIAKANKLAHPGLIHSGNILVLPR